MSANPAITTSTTPLAPGAPSVNLNVTDPAAVEIKKFMTSEEGLPETAGLRVRVVPGQDTDVGPQLGPRAARPGAGAAGPAEWRGSRSDRPPGPAA